MFNFFKEIKQKFKSHSFQQLKVFKILHKKSDYTINIIYKIIYIFNMNDSHHQLNRIVLEKKKIELDNLKPKNRKESFSLRSS